MSKDYRKKIDDIMNQIQYGWVDSNGNRHTELQGFSSGYAFQFPEELLKSKLGVCWDQVELERKLFADENINVTPFFIVYYDDKKCPTHTFVIFEEDGKFIWYEHAWEKFAGWHEFDSLESALETIRNNFIEVENIDVKNPLNLCVYMNYPTPEKKLGCLDFYNHCEDKRNPRFKFKGAK